MGGSWRSRDLSVIAKSDHCIVTEGKNPSSNDISVGWCLDAAKCKYRAHISGSSNGILKQWESEDNSNEFLVCDLL